MKKCPKCGADRIFLGIFKLIGWCAQCRENSNNIKEIKKDDSILLMNQKDPKLNGVFKIQNIEILDD